MRIRIVIDVDDTICTNIRRLPYDRCEPIPEAIDKINYLHDKRGYYIILYTARGMVSCNGIVSEAISKNKATLEKWLELNNVHYDELVFGKPIADLYVDDKALNKDDFIKEEFYPLKGGGSKRKVERIGRFVKKDLGSPEDTERFKDWIEDCGEECAHPGIISYLYSGVYMDYIDGENLCDCMTEEDLHSVIEIIEGFKKKKKDTLDLDKQVQILESNYSGERDFDSIIAKLEAMKIYNSLSKGGTTLRLRPFIVGVSDKTYLQLIEAAAEAGASAVTTEFFCLEMRSINHAREHYKTISECCGFDIVDFYRKYSNGSGYLRLNRKVKEKYVKNMQDLCHKLGMRFYVSDAHFKECCDNCSCCALPQEWDYSRGNFSGALQIAKKTGEVRWSDIEKDMYFLDFEWNKAEGFNTNSAEARAKFRDMTMKDYLRYLWNNPKRGQSPYHLFEKVLLPDGEDENGDIIYKYNQAVTFEPCLNLKREAVNELRV